jgi:hypothetical protein
LLNQPHLVRSREVNSICLLDMRLHIILAVWRQKLRLGHQPTLIARRDIELRVALPIALR